MDDYELLDKCRAYIGRQHTVLWGQYFDINKEAGKEAAVHWLAEVIDDVLREDKW